MLTEQTAKEMLELLTPKHREVLDLVNEHNSSKEIARLLGVAPTTVEYRLKSVRTLWNTDNRNATMRLYNELLAACEDLQSQTDGPVVSAMPQSGAPGTAPKVVSATALTPLEDRRSDIPKRPSGRFFKLEVFDASFGIAGRAMLVLLIAFVIIVIGAGSLFIAEALSRLA